MDGNRLRIWYWGYDLAQISPTDTTYHVNLVGSDLHPQTGQWGIGTSQYVYTNMASVTEHENITSDITIGYYQNLGTITVPNDLPSLLNVYSINGQLIYQNTFTNTINFNVDYEGVILINVVNDNSVETKKYVSFK
jgi:hypothetical protein